MLIDKLRDKRVKHFILTALLCLFSATPLISSSVDAPSFRNILLPFLLSCAVFPLYARQIRGVDFLYPLLCLEAVISTSFSSYIGMERTGITYLLFALTVVIYANFQYDPTDLRRFVDFYICMALVCAALIAMSWIADIQHSYNRYSLGILGISKNPNYINSIILLSCAVLMYRLVTSREKRPLRGLLLAALIFGCILTGTRAAVLTIALCAGLAILYLLVASKKWEPLLRFIREKRRLFLIICAAFVVSIVLIVLFLPNSVIRRFSLQKMFHDDLRMYMWKMSFLQFLEHPFLGLGLNGTTAYNTTLELSVTNIHNVLLQFLCDQGILGLCIFISIIWQILRRTRKQDRFLILMMGVALYFPILFQNGLVAFTFWWPLLILEVFSRASQRKELAKFI